MSVYVATGKILSISRGVCTVRPNGRGRDDAPWPDVVECKLMSLTGAAGKAGLYMAPSAGDDCILLFTGDDMSEPLCIPATNSGSDKVVLVHGQSHVILNENRAIIQSGQLITLSAGQVDVNASQISLRGNVTVVGNLSVSGSMTNTGVNVGAGHRHSNGTLPDGNTGGVIR